MDIEEKNKLTIDELNGIILGLRIENFAHVEPKALIEIQAMIQTLPSREMLGKLADNPSNIEKIQSDIGKIMRLIEVYGKRDAEYKTRYKARTELEPRYMTFEDNTMDKAARNNLAKDLIKLSIKTEEAGYEDISQSLIDCAKDVYANKIPLKDIYSSTKAILWASISNGKLTKSAQAVNTGLTDINIDFSDITNGLQKINEWFKNMKSAIQAKKEYAQKNPRTGIFLKSLDAIWKQIDQIHGSTRKQLNQVNNELGKVRHKMEDQLVPQRAEFTDGKAYDIKWEKDPTDEGYEKAVIYPADGRKYEVQEWPNGKRDFKDVTETVAPVEEPAVTEPVSEATPLPEESSAEPQVRAPAPLEPEVAPEDKTAPVSLPTQEEMSKRRQEREEMSKRRQERENKHIDKTNEAEETLRRNLDEMAEMQKNRNAPAQSEEKLVETPKEVVPEVPILNPVEQEMAPKNEEKVVETPAVPAKPKKKTEKAKQPEMDSSAIYESFLSPSRPSKQPPKVEFPTAIPEVLKKYVEDLHSAAKLEGTSDEETKRTALRPVIADAYYRDILQVAKGNESIEENYAEKKNYLEQMMSAYIRSDWEKRQAKRNNSVSNKTKVKTEASFNLARFKRLS